MIKSTKPIESDNQRKKCEKKRPSREEELEYFRQAAKQDLAVQNLFSKRNLPVIDRNDL